MQKSEGLIKEKQSLVVDVSFSFLEDWYFTLPSKSFKLSKFYNSKLLKLIY